MKKAMMIIMFFAMAFPVLAQDGKTPEEDGCEDARSKFDKEQAAVDELMQKQACECDVLNCAKLEIDQMGRKLDPTDYVGDFSEAFGEFFKKMMLGVIGLQSEIISILNSSLEVGLDWYKGTLDHQPTEEELREAEEGIKKMKRLNQKYTDTLVAATRIQTQQVEETEKNKEKMKEMKAKWDAGLQKLLDACPELSNRPVEYPDMKNMDCMDKDEFPHWPSCSKNTIIVEPEGDWRNLLENCNQGK